MSEDSESIESLAGRGLVEPDTITDQEVARLCGWILPRYETPPTPTMSEEVRAELTARRDAFARKADKRRDEPGFEANVAELDAWVAEIDGELG